MNRSARVILGALILVVGVYLYHVVHSNHSSPPQDANRAAATPALQPSPSLSQNELRAKPPAPSTSGSVPVQKEKSAVTANQQPVAGGLVAVIDSATGRLREADATDIGAVGAPQPALQRRALTLAAPVTPEVTTFAGPGGSTGAVLSDDQMAFMVVTKAPDGKLTTDCVTGKKAADARIGANLSKSKKEAKKAQPAQQKETLDEM